MYIVVSAPSGTGKTSILREVLKMCPNMLFSVSYTTRLPRPGEEDGKDYYFISDEAFRDRITQGEFAEWEEYSGNLYGTSAKTMKAFLEKGLDLILDVETRGAKALKNKYSGGVFVFILPPSIGELKKRLNKRGFESEQMMNKRTDKALDEIKESIWYDYVIFNDRIETAIDTLRAIYVAEKSRRERSANKIKCFLV
ncbi:MAG: guanylate kinase [Deltaproteobacteria bacterium]|nr:guanylate kinase [Deltaproteobacteria bacterium]